jgi:hypothetical protein
MRRACLINEKLPVAYKSHEEFLQDLRRVLSSDYGIECSDETLEETGRNIDGFLRCFF